MSTFSKNVLQLVSGSVVAQFLGFLLTPIITRIYLPGDFGILQLFLSISNIIVAFSSLSYDRAILLPQEDDDSATLLVLSIILISIISLISGVILVVFSEEIGTLLNTPQISQYLVIVPIAAWVTGIFAVGNVWLSRRKRFGRIASAQVVNTVITRVSQMGIGLISAVAFGLIFGWLVGSCAALVVVHLTDERRHLSFQNCHDTESEKHGNKI